MTLGEFIKRRRKELGLSAEQIADYCGIAPSTVYRWENGDTEKIPAGQLKRLASVLHCKPSALIDDEQNDILLPNPEAIRSIPVYNDISCGTGLFVDDDITDIITIPASMLPNKSADYFAQYAVGDSMINAGIHAGDLIVFRKTNIIENGQIGCFCIDNNKATCKKFSKHGGSIFLLPANDNYQPIPILPENDCFRILGVKALLISKEK